MKIIITGIDIIDKLDIAKHISYNNDLSIANYFTSDKEYENKISENYINYLDPNIINLSYKNNAFLYIETKDFISNGITLDEFYNNDIICVSTKNFNQIIDNIFDNNDCLVIWLDTKYHNNLNIKEELREINYLEKRIENLKYLYFLDEDKNVISDVIANYIKGDDEIKNNLLLEYC